MAASTWLTQYQSIKSSSECLIVAIEDVNDLWPLVKDSFEARIPLKKTFLNNKAHNPVVVEKLPVEFVQTTDPRLRARFPLEQSPFVFRLPYATILLVTCEDIDDYKGILKPRIKLMVQNEDREWFIVFVSKANSQDPTGKQAKRIYSKLEVDFSSKRRERCCKLDISAPDAVSWEEIEARMSECIRNTLDRRIQFYDDEVKRLSESRSMAGWNFHNLFIVKESLAFMFELACLHEDALREYDELEQIYLELVNTPSTKLKDFGGLDPGDDRAALLEVSRKAFTQFAVEDSFREFDFRQYLFAHQASLLFNMNRPIDVAGRGLYFIFLFSKLLSLHQKDLPFCMREVWVITACLLLIKATVEHFTPRSVNPDAEKEFYRLQADLNSLARTKLMRLVDLMGYGAFIERSPCNSALLSMTPWPKPSVWPSIPPDAAARILAKEQAVQEKSKSLGAPSSQLPLAPSMLLREANRRRASLSAGSVADILESRLSFKESPVAEGSASPSQASPANSMQRTTSSSGRPGSPMGSSPSLSPSPSRTSFDRPMKLAEIHAAAEHEILKLVTHEGLQKALSSFEGFEGMYLELTRAAADNYHRSRKRHGVVLDGEIAAVHYRIGNFDSAAKLYEKVCALYSGERWHALLAEVLPRLAECQKQLGELGGYLSSCIKLLSLDHSLLRIEQRNSLQSEVLRLAHSGLKVPVPVDVSSLITFCGQSGPPLELCEGDPGTLPVTVWSGFPDEISLGSLSMTLSPTFSTDEGAKAIKSAEGPVLQPGKNTIVMLLQPQRPGSYVLGAFTGQIGQVKLRSHTYCTISAISSRGGSPDSDDYLSTERPLRAVLQVLMPRPLVEIKAVVSTGLLIGEPQWLGLVIRPIDYSLKGAILHISTLPGLSLHGRQLCQLQLYNRVAWTVDSPSTADVTATNAAGTGRKHLENTVEEKTRVENGIILPEDTNVLELKNGSLELPDWASDVVSVMWLRVLAKRTKDDTSGGIQHLASHATYPDADGVVPNIAAGKDLQNGTAISEGARGLDVKLEFGVTRNRLYERPITLAFTEAFRAATRVVAKGNAGMFLLQVTLISQINAAVTILDATLNLQDGFLLVGNKEGRPEPLWLLPIAISGNSECALLFVIKSNDRTGSDDNSGLTLPNGGYEKTESASESVLRIRYKISGNRAFGAQPPPIPKEIEGGNDLVFKASFMLQMPVLNRLVAVGLLPVPCSCPRVGQQVILQWRVERLKTGMALSAGANDSAAEFEELAYEIKASPENWMVAGKRKGYVSLPTHAGARVVVSMACVPLIAGHVHPPSLDLSSVKQTHISHSPPGPHLVCIYPPAPCYAFCVTTRNSSRK